MKVDTTQVLMSDVLKGQVPVLEDDVRQQVAVHQVIVIAERVVAGKTEPMVGVLRGVLLGKEPEIEFRCDLKEALDVLEAHELSFGRFELHHIERVLSLPGPFIVKAARIDEISVTDQVCTLGLHLSRAAR